MTHEETIKALDNLIIYLNRFIAENEPPSNIVNNVIRKLKELDISANVIKTIASVAIEEPNSFFQYSLDLLHFESERKKKNRASIQSMIEILKVEQKRHKQILVEEEKQKAMEEQAKNLELQERAIAEQKEANRISKRALWFSAVATIASVIATVISIIALYK
jgi:hypothetical protein